MEDAPAVESACRDPEIPRWIPWAPRPYSRTDAETYLRECLESGDDRYPFAVVDSKTDELLGAIDMGLNSQRYRGNIGYWVVAGARGQGVCMRALRDSVMFALLPGELVEE